MPTIHALPVATTEPGTPRESQAVDYEGTSNTTVRVQLVCPTWATGDPAITVKVEVQQSFDNEATWEAIATLETNVGRVNRVGGLPSMACQSPDDFGTRRARCVLSVENGSIDLGVDVTV